MKGDVLKIPIKDEIERLKDIYANSKCDECWRGATTCARDLIRTKNADGRWGEFVLAGGYRYGCLEHPVRQQEIWKDD